MAADITHTISPTAVSNEVTSRALGGGDASPEKAPEGDRFCQRFQVMPGVERADPASGPVEKKVAKAKRVDCLINESDHCIRI